MTIVIGMLCEGGALLCADTKGVMGDGSVFECKKIRVDSAKWGTFAIADSANDAYAAQTLIGRIVDSLKVSAISKWKDLIASVSCEMEEWCRPFKEIPDTSLLLVCSIYGLGVQMYLCQPPNTVIEKREYAAIGCGSAVTDALEGALFKTSDLSVLQHPQKNLRQISYLMYRAKKDHAFCGMRTQGVYVRCDADTELINPLDLEAAEKQSQKLDFLLRATTAFALFSDPGANLQTNAKGIGDMLIGLSGLRAVQFHRIEGEIIGGRDEQ